MSPTTLGLIVSGVLAAATVVGWIGSRPGSTAEKVLLACLPVTVVAFAACLVLDVNAIHDARERAIETIEQTHGVSIDIRGRYSEFPDDWKIDGIWRTCYLSTDDMDKAAEADLMCETPIQGKAPYTKIAPVE